MALANRRAYLLLAERQEIREIARSTDLVRYFFLVFLGEIDKMIILRANKKWNSCLIEAAALSIPFFDRVESALPCEIKHKEDSHSVVADERKHVDKLPLSAKVPY